jgi:CIC family chloride channel protein
LITILSVVVGIIGGMSAVVIKNGVRLLSAFLHRYFIQEDYQFLYLIFPAFGILLAVIFVRYILREYVGHGIPSVLYAISKQDGIMKPHNTFSSVITSILTVGFGGSVGLEGPTLATGAAWGSNIGRLLRLKYRYVILLLGLACSASFSAIFKAPIAAIIFSVEVLSIDLTLSSVIPLLIASATAVLVSYFFLGQAVLYPFEITHKFDLVDFPYYIILGVIAGLTSIYFTKAYIFIEQRFKRIKKWHYKILTGGVILGLLIFLFPALYGEGYQPINTALHNDPWILFQNSVFAPFKDNIYVLFLVMLLVILLKSIATSVTFGSGGIGGIFAPTLFTGVFAGLFSGKLINILHIGTVSEANFAMVSMGGLISGVLLAPLTGMFLVAELTGGYGLFIPLMITCTLSYVTTKLVIPNSVYTYQLAEKGELITLNKDKTVLKMMNINKLLETNFITVKPGDTLGDLVKVVSNSTRNIFPVIDKDGIFCGMVVLDDIRKIMFRPELYDTTFVLDLMFYPPVFVNIEDSMEEVAQKFYQSGRYVLPVLKEGKYMGFVSRANVFSDYRKRLQYFSQD